MSSTDETRLANLTSLAELEPMAKERLSAMAYDYVAGGAGDEHTVAWNSAAFARMRLSPRVLTDVSSVDTRVNLLGLDLPHPVVLAPTAYHRLMHPEGEVATARGAGATGALLIVSSFATTPLEEIGAAATAPLWFQLYVQKDRGITRDLIDRAVSAGCRAICLTVDTPVLGARGREMRRGFDLPGLDRPNLRGGAVPSDAPHRPAAGNIYNPLLDASLTWRDIAWLKGVSPVPVVLKGILSPEDARLAVDSGADGIVVSNHGGRNLDTLPASLDALPRVAESIRGRIPIVFDGGVRRGSDVLKAIALGATAVGIGRPYLYALAVAGAVGVARAIELLRLELMMAMALTGRVSIADVDSSVLWPE